MSEYCSECGIYSNGCNEDVRFTGETQTDKVVKDVDQEEEEEEVQWKSWIRPKTT